MEALLGAVDALEALVAQAMRLADRPHDRQYSNALRRAISDTVAHIGDLGPHAFDDAKCRYAFQPEFALLRSAMIRHLAPRRTALKCEPNRAVQGSLKGMGLASGRFVGWVRSVGEVRDAPRAIALEEAILAAADP